MCSNSVLTKQLLDLWLKSRKSYPWNGSDPTLDSYISTIVNKLNSCLSPTRKLGKSVPHNCYDLRIVLEKWNRTEVVKRAVEFHSAIHLPCDFGQVTLSHKKSDCKRKRAWGNANIFLTSASYSSQITHQNDLHLVPPLLGNCLKSEPFILSPCLITAILKPVEQFPPV